MTSTTTLEPQTFANQDREVQPLSGGSLILWNGVILADRGRTTKRRYDPAGIIILSELTKLIDYRYGVIDGRDDAEWVFDMVLPYLTPLDGHRRSRWTPKTWAQAFTPCLVDDEWETYLFQARSRAWKRPSVDEIAQTFHITPEEVAACQLRTLSDHTRTKEVRVKDRKAKDRDRHEATRRAEGKLTRDEYLAQEKAKSEARKKEAAALGISVRSLQRREKSAREEQQAWEEEQRLAA
jgi:hypothetical protein